MTKRNQAKYKVCKQVNANLWDKNSLKTLGVKKLKSTSLANLLKLEAPFHYKFDELKTSINVKNTTTEVSIYLKSLIHLYNKELLNKTPVDDYLEKALEFYTSNTAYFNNIEEFATTQHLQLVETISQLTAKADKLSGQGKLNSTELKELQKLLLPLVEKVKAAPLFEVNRMPLGVIYNKSVIVSTLEKDIQKWISGYLFLTANDLFLNKKAFFLEKLKQTKPTITSFNKKTKYGEALLEKQKFRNFYSNVTEKQFFSAYTKAAKTGGKIGYNLMLLLESRLDTVLYRMNLVGSMGSARQLINHNKVTVNNVTVTVASYNVKPNDCIAIKPEAKENIFNFLANTVKSKTLFIDAPKYLEVNYKTLQGVFIYYPNTFEVLFSTKMNPKAVTEFYNI